MQNFGRNALTVRVKNAIKKLRWIIWMKRHKNALKPLPTAGCYIPLQSRWSASVSLELSLETVISPRYHYPNHVKKGATRMVGSTVRYSGGETLEGVDSRGCLP